MPSESKSTLIFDGDCGFCRFWVRRWQGQVKESITFQSSEEAASAHPEIPPERFRESVVFVEETGEVSYGARAVFKVMAHAPRRKWLLWCYDHLPGANRFFEFAYRFIARHRNSLGAVARWLRGG